MSDGRLVVETARLTLRRWQTRDQDALARMYADPQVMRYIGNGQVRSRTETRAAIERMEQHWTEHGFGLWAAVLKDSGELIGRIGLATPTFLPEVLPATEVGFLVGRPHWGRGLATEGARASLAYAFDRLGLDRVIGIYFPENVSSGRVMEKLGMRRERDTIHPEVGRLVRVYEIRRSDYLHAH
jgi:RimJ/RimL family protein N-acetyltransferase